MLVSDLDKEYDQALWSHSIVCHPWQDKHQSLMRPRHTIDTVNGTNNNKYNLAHEDKTLLAHERQL